MLATQYRSNWEGSMRVARRCVAGAAAVVLAASFVAVPLASSAGATTFNVTNNHDSGAGSLRQAVLDAAAASGANTVSVQAGLSTITLASPISWNANGLLTIHGNGVTIDGGGHGGALTDSGGDGLTADNFTIKDAGGSTTGDAAPVVSEGGAISLSTCTISGSAVSTDDDVAGGVLSEGLPVSITNCKITGNSGTSTGGDAAGGVLSEGGTTTLTNSTVTGNSGTSSDGDAGGGVLSEGGDVIVASSTVSGNTGTTPSGDVGGGIISEGGNVTFRTVQDNCNTASGTSTEAGDAAGGILSEGGDVTVTSSNILGNRATTQDTEAKADNGVLLGGGTLTNNGTTISDDQTVCTAPPTTTSTTAASTTTTTAAVQAVAATPAFTG
jgi:hypothetical protein